MVAPEAFALRACEKRAAKEEERKAEEERKVTDTYKEKPAEPKAAPEAPKKMKKKPADVDIEKDRQAYKPGQTWQTSSGRFGAKNSQSKIGYFGSLERAKQFAKK